MSLASTMVLYFMLGVGVAGALLVREGLQGAAGGVRLAIACVFWPLYVPVLLAPQPSARDNAPDAVESNDATGDPILAEIARVESELESALRTLDGWAEGALALEDARFDELSNAWRVQAQRIQELGDLLNASEEQSSVPDDPMLPPDSIRQSVRARRDNIERLRQLHQRMQNDLLGNLAWVRELVTLIHLAKYTGAPASRAEELVAQIAAAVEGLSEVSDWRTNDEPVAAVR
jgi:hypothetical protein